VFIVPGAWVPFYSQWVLDKVMKFLTYNGTIFTGIVAVTIVDYVVLRQCTLSPTHIFTQSRYGRYWFWNGFNWIGIGVTLLGVAISLAIYDPYTLRVAPVFRYVGASVPAMVVCATLYYVLMRWYAIPQKKGGYGNGEQGSNGAEVVKVTL
jgi:NCS1 family nucleobase:cation symporter-1